MGFNFSSVVLVFLLFAASCYAIPSGQVAEICKQTRNPSLCSTLLNSNPSANLVTLTQYTIDTARANVTNTIKLINYLIALNAKNPEAKAHYTNCLENFGPEGALGDVDYTKELLKKGDYQGVNSAASAVIDDVEDCISGEVPPVPLFQDPSMLPKYAAVLESVLDITFVLSKYLMR